MAASRGNARVVAVAVQIRAPATGGRQGRVLGILVAAYGLDTIQRFVDDYAVAQGVRLTVTDQRGVVVAAPGASHRGLQSRRDDPLVAAALERRSGISERTTPEGRVVWGDTPITGVRMGPDGQLYQLRTSRTGGVDIARYSLDPVPHDTPPTTAPAPKPPAPKGPQVDNGGIVGSPVTAPPAQPATPAATQSAGATL